MLVGIYLLMLVVMIGGLGLHFKLSEPAYKIAKKELKRTKKREREREIREAIHRHDQALMPIGYPGPIQPLRAGHPGGAEAAFFAQAEADRKLQEALRGERPQAGLTDLIASLEKVFPWVLELATRCGLFNNDKPAPSEAPTKKEGEPNIDLDPLDDVPIGGRIAIAKAEIFDHIHEEIERLREELNNRPPRVIQDAIAQEIEKRVRLAKEEILSHPRLKDAPATKSPYASPLDDEELKKRNAKYIQDLLDVSEDYKEEAAWNPGYDESVEMGLYGLILNCTLGVKGEGLDQVGFHVTAGHQHLGRADFSLSRVPATDKFLAETRRRQETEGLTLEELISIKPFMLNSVTPVRITVLDRRENPTPLTFFLMGKAPKE
jgi:hypothetical protein